MASSCSRKDQQALNQLIGRAMTHAELEKALLAQATRQHVLEGTALSDRARKVVFEIEDMPSLDALACRIHRLLFEDGAKQA